MIKNIFASKVVQNASWLIGCRIIQMMINLLVSIVIARYLGPSNYGVINYATSLIAFFSSLSTLGLNSVLVKEIVDKPEDEGIIIGTSLILKTIAGLFSSSVIIGIAYVSDKNDSTTILIVAITTLGIVFHVFDTLNYWFQSKLQSKISAVATLSGHTITAIYRIFLIITKQNIVWFAFATSLDYICSASVLIYQYYKKGGKRWLFSSKYARSILKKSCHFILPGLMISVYAQTDKIMLKHIINDSAVGIYSTAVTLCGSWTFILNAIIDSMNPSIMQASNTDEELFKRRNRQLYAMIFYCSMGASLIITFLAEPIISVAYGSDYGGAIVPLRIVTWYTAFSFLGGARNTWVVCKNKQKYLVWISFSAAMTNVILNVLLIPRLGEVGAGIASLVTQITTILIWPIMIKDLRANVKLMIEGILLKIH